MDKLTLTSKDTFLLFAVSFAVQINVQKVHVGKIVEVEMFAPETQLIF